MQAERQYGDQPADRNLFKLHDCVCRLRSTLPIDSDVQVAGVACYEAVAKSNRKV